MTPNEREARDILDKYLPNVTEEQMVKKLGEELVELSMAIGKNDRVNILEETGDCLFILFHILCKYKTDASLGNSIVLAAQKLERRFKNGYYNKKNESVL